MKRDPFVKLLGVTLLSIFVIWLVVELLLPATYGMGFSVRGNFGGSHMYLNTGFGVGGTLTVLLTLLVKLFFILFVVGLVVGLVVVVKNILFTQEGTCAGTCTGTKQTCSECGKEINSSWKACPYCGKEVE